jgi:DUF1680 family protein
MRKLFFYIFVCLCFASKAQTVCRQFPLADVKLLPSRFQRNMQRDSAWIASIPVKSLLHSFRNTAGVFTEKEGGYMTMQHLAGWKAMDCDLRGHITGHLLSSMAYLQMKEKADSLVQGLAEVQRQYGTGYLAAYGEGLIDRNIQGKSVWAPFYTMHKILQGLLDQYTMCDNATALQVARGMGNWAYAKLKPLSEETRTRMIRNEFGGFNEAMYNLYALTRDDRYLWVAHFFYHDEKINPLKQGNTDLGTNHANTFIPKLLGECRNYELFGDADSRQAAALLYNTLVGDHAFVTGEVSDKEHLFNPETQSNHLTGYNGENCCTYNLLKLSDCLFTYQPDSRIADYYERALYNHILGQQDTLSSMVCYFTPLMTGAYRLYSTRDSSFWCCVGSGSGKTTVARGLMALLKDEGMEVQPFKCGPDYIDTKFHTAVCTRPSVNLDTFMASEEHVSRLYARYSQGAGVCIAEGMMGLYDGYERDKGSSAAIAATLRLPVVLVADARSMAYSMAPLPRSPAKEQARRRHGALLWRAAPRRSPLFTKNTSTCCTGWAP